MRKNTLTNESSNIFGNDILLKKYQSQIISQARQKDPNNPSIFNLDGLKSIENAISNRNKKKIYSALHSIMKKNESKFGKSKGIMKLWKCNVSKRRAPLGKNIAINCYKDKDPETGEKFKIRKPRLVADSESFYWGQKSQRSSCQEPELVIGERSERSSYKSLRRSQKM